MALNPQEEIEYLELKKRRAMASGAGSGAEDGAGIGSVVNNVLNALPGSQLSGREQIGSMLGQGVGGYVGGYPGEVAGGGLGAVLGDVGPGILRQTGQLMTLQKPTPVDMNPDQMSAAFKGGAGQAATFGAIPKVWSGVKAGGRGLVNLMGALEGTTERLSQMKKLSLLEKFKVMNPTASSSIPSPDIAGKAQGDIQRMMGIPTPQEAVDLEELYKVKKAPKTPKTFKEVKIPTDLTPTTGAAGAGGTTSAEAKKLQDIIRTALGGGEAGAGAGAGAAGQFPKQGINTAEKAQTALRVHQTLEAMQKGAQVEPPSIQDAITAIQYTAERMAKETNDVNKAVLSANYGRLKNYISDVAEPLAKARHLTHLSHIREDLSAVAPINEKSGLPNRFGLLRGLWALGTLFTPGGLGAKAALMTVPMMPYAGGAAVLGGDIATRALDPILTNKATPYVARALAAMRGKQQPMPQQ